MYMLMLKLLENEEIQAGEEINVTVPTGNFGNILAAYYAKQMGVPIAKLICASNDNKVLFDFFQTGVYDRNREFILDIFTVHGYSDLKQPGASDLHNRRTGCTEGCRAHDTAERKRCV